MSSQALIRRNDAALTVEFTQSAIALKNQALEAAANIGKVVDAATQEAAVLAQRELANVLTLVEKARKEAKDPVLTYGRAIDDAARNFVQEAKDEQVRIATLVGDFQALEAAKARAAEQLRLAEERKAAEERRQAELAALRAAEEEKRKLAEREREIARLAAEAKSKREKEILAQQQAEVDRQRALSEASTHAELDKIQERHNNAMAAIAEQPRHEPARAAGQRIQEDWEVSVTDIWLLAKAHPTCVRIEPLMGEIKSLLKAGVKVSGVKADKIVKAGVTRGRPMAAIEV